jgi:FkbM family methyltransferase
MTIKHRFRRILWRFGYDISKFAHTSHPLARRQRLLQHYQIDTVLDIGANSGQFARELREDIGYTQHILSFEPLSQVFKSLEKNAKDDQAWDVFNYAIGDAEEKREINIAENSLSSSLLNILPSHLESAPDSRYIGKEVIEIRTLDAVFDGLCKSAKNIYMKIDAQGFEDRVLKGAENSLARINTVQVEMSLVPLYDGELLFTEMCMLMRAKGYTLVAIEDGFSDPASGQLLQIDGIFHRIRSLEH